MNLLNVLKLHMNQSTIFEEAAAYHSKKIVVHQKDYRSHFFLLSQSWLILLLLPNLSVSIIKLFRENKSLWKEKYFQYIREACSGPQIIEGNNWDDLPLWHQSLVGMFRDISFKERCVSLRFQLSERPSRQKERHWMAFRLAKNKTKTKNCDFQLAEETGAKWDIGFSSHHKHTTFWKYIIQQLHKHVSN